MKLIFCNCVKIRYCNCLNLFEKILFVNLYIDVKLLRDFIDILVCLIKC